MTFNPHTPADREAMLAAIGVDRMDDLFSAIPAGVRCPELQLPPRLTEMEAAARLGELAARNVYPRDGETFLGAGSYHHYLPATAGQILSRAEFYTLYMPYQPAVS